MSAVVIGASAGATEALSVILPALPTTFAAPIFLVVHVPTGMKNLLLELLGPRSRLPLCEVEDKTPVVSGTVYVAPPDYHVLVETDGRLSLSISEPVNFSRPSIDVLFESAADVYGPGLVGVLLSGASEDGARGLSGVRDRGGRTVVQDPETAQVKTMPAAAIRRGAAEHVLTPLGIAELLAQASAEAIETRSRPSAHHV
jgi:two-component system chemotaxis response regulator CheB